jgi:4-hydroxy 2-oxovalerate aldolase
MIVKIMDCTLRDGGYRNNWQFSPNQAKFIISELNSAKIEYIECGYLTGKPVTRFSTRFTSPEIFNELLAEIAGTIKAKLYLMADLRDIGAIKLPESRYPDGLRLAFHKQDYLNISEAVKKIIASGYQICLQPMVTSLYTDDELLRLAEAVNEFSAAAFYIVDSFGNLGYQDLNRLFLILDKSLKPSISLGFHPHNNLQLAYANTIHLLNFNSSRQIIVDASVCGIGRGTGNLNTEILIKHLVNNNHDYGFEPVLRIIDQVLTEIFPEKDFKNSSAYFLGASRGCHPNYPALFAGMDDLKITDINNLINRIAEKNLNLFNKEYAEKLLVESGFGLGLMDSKD